MLTYNTLYKNQPIAIKIKLLNNSFVTTWKDYVIRTSQRLPNLHWSVHPHHVIEQLSKDVNYKIFIINLLKSFILLGKHYNIDYSKEISELKNFLIDYSNLTQQDLNRWHRHFTSLGKLLNPFTTVETFTELPQHVIHHAVHELNNNTHLLETLTYPKLSRLTKFSPNHLNYGIHATSTNQMSDKESIWGSETVEYINEEFDFNNSSYDHDVWLTDDILGKDHFKCWFEEDDPTNDDITGNLLLTPNITLDPNKIFKQTIDDIEFQKFVTNSNKKLNRFPLGDILNINEIPWHKITECQLKNIELDGNILWNNA